MDMAATYRIYPLKVGSLPNLPKVNTTYLMNQGIFVEAPLFAFLLQGSNGKNILVDTGCWDREYAWNLLNYEVHVSDEDHVLAVLKRDFDLEAADIDCVINTHLHFDHCFANHCFPGKPIYIQKAEIAFAKNPWPFFAVTYEAPSIGFSPNWLKAEDQIVPVEGTYEIAEGITLIPLPGHSPGMQGVLVDTEKGKYLLPGDQVNLYEQLEPNPVLPYIISGIHTSVADCMDSMEKILALMAEGVTVLPSHDEKIGEHRCYPAE